MAHATGSLDVIERFLASEGGPGAAAGELLRWIKAELKAGNIDPLGAVFPRLLIPGLDYTTANALHHLLGQLRQKARLHDRTAKIAVLGSFTTHQLVSLLELFLAAGRVGVEIYEADYGTLRQEILDPDSGLVSLPAGLHGGRHDLARPGASPRVVGRPRGSAAQGRGGDRGLDVALGRRACPAGLPDHPEQFRRPAVAGTGEPRGPAPGRFRTVRLAREPRVCKTPLRRT